MELQSIILDGWPEKRNEVPVEIRKYWAFRDEMAVADGLVTKGDCVIIPKTLRRDILEKLHAAHQGIEKTRLRARTCVYWSGINGDIEEMINKCGICQEVQHAQRSEPLLQHEVPTRPWQNVGTDLFAIGNRNYLIVTDYYSKFPFVKEVTGAVTNQAVVRLTKEIFSEQGVPATTAVSIAALNTDDSASSGSSTTQRPARISPSRTDLLNDRFRPLKEHFRRPARRRSTWRWHY